MPRTKCYQPLLNSTFGSRAFPIAAAKIWNTPPRYDVLHRLNWGSCCSSNHSFFYATSLDFQVVCIS